MVYLLYGFHIYVLTELHPASSTVRYVEHYEVVGIESSTGMASSTLACDCVNHINGNWESVEHALNNFDSNVGRVALSSTTQLHKV